MFSTSLDTQYLRLTLEVHLSLYTILNWSCIWWCIQEAEVRGQPVLHIEFQATQGYVVRPRLKAKPTNQTKLHWCRNGQPLIPLTLMQKWAAPYTPWSQWQTCGCTQCPWGWVSTRPGKQVQGQSCTTSWYLNKTLLQGIWTSAPSPVSPKIINTTAVLGMEPRSTTELHSLPLKTFFPSVLFFLDKISLYSLGCCWTPTSYCLSFISAGITGVYHNSQIKITFNYVKSVPRFQFTSYNSSYSRQPKKSARKHSQRLT